MKTEYTMYYKLNYLLYLILFKVFTYQFWWYNKCFFRYNYLFSLFLSSIKYCCDEKTLRPIYHSANRLGKCKFLCKCICNLKWGQQTRNICGNFFSWVQNINASFFDRANFIWGGWETTVINMRTLLLLLVFIFSPMLFNYVQSLDERYIGFFNIVKFPVNT